MLRSVASFLLPATLLLGATHSETHVSVDPASLLDASQAERWIERRLANRKNSFRFIEHDEASRLRVESLRSASAIYLPLEVAVDSDVRVSWRWRVDEPVTHARSERTKRGDDYSARLAVMFDGKPFGRKTRAIMYVWAHNEPVGADFPSPYTPAVETVVLQSRATLTKRWVVESRDVIRDFERLFGESPERITAVAIMVDTDNTESSAVTWFDRLSIGAHP